MEKKNLLIAISSLTGGGAELVAANLCKYIDRGQFNVTVCHLKERGEKGMALAGAGFDVVGLSDNHPGKPDYLSFLKMRRLIQEKKIHIVHSHSTDTLIDAALCKISLRRLKSVHTFHFGNYPHYDTKYLFLEKLFRRIPDRLVAVGNAQRKAIQGTFNVPEDKMKTIWNGVERNHSGIDHDLMDQFISRDKILIGSISTFIEQKGLPHLLDVMYELKKRRDDFLCLVVGDGPLRPELERKRRDMGLDETVIFMGWVEDAATRVLPTLSIFFQPSLWEAMSIVVLEAMSAGKPVVATNVGENRHVVEQGETGFLVEPRDVSGMVEAMEKLIASPDLCARMGKLGRRRFEKHFTVDGMVSQYMHLYEVLLPESSI